MQIQIFVGRQFKIDKDCMGYIDYTAYIDYNDYMHSIIRIIDVKSMYNPSNLWTQVIQIIEIWFNFFQKYNANNPYNQ